MEDGPWQPCSHPATQNVLHILWKPELHSCVFKSLLLTVHISVPRNYFQITACCTAILYHVFLPPDSTGPNIVITESVSDYCWAGWLGSVYRQVHVHFFVLPCLHCQGSIQPPIQWVPGTLSLMVKWLGCESWPFNNYQLLRLTLWGPLATFYYTRFNIKNSTFWPQSVCLCFVWISK
jgi:hypothetical protein